MQTSLPAIPVVAPPVLGGRRSYPLGWITLAALFFLVLGTRLWLVETYGNALPFWDQWDAEAGEVLKPWLDGRLKFANLLQPHAEHRILPTRALALGLVAINGQWDGCLEMAVNAVLCAGVAVGLAVALQRALRPRLGNTIVFGVAGVFCLPFAWENTLAGFQSQFYFLLGNSLLALWGLGTRRTLSLGWCAGAAGAVLACVSMGSGFFAPAAVLGFGIVRALRDRAWPGFGQFLNWLFCFLVVAVAWQHRVNVPEHAFLRAQSAGAMLGAFGRCLAWPQVTHPAWAFCSVLPLGLLAWVWGQRHRLSAPAEERADSFLLLLAGWVLLQATAIAYARGGGTPSPASRYMDLLALGALLSLLAVALMAVRQPASTRRRRVALAGAMLWTLALLVGLATLTAQNFSQDLPLKRAYSRAVEANTRAYVLTGDRVKFTSLPRNEANVPYPDFQYLLALLDDNKVRALLPADVRAPLHFGDSSKTGFREDVLPPTVTPASLVHIFSSFLPDAGGATAQGQLTTLLMPRPALPYLQFAIAGDLGRPGLRLWLHDERTSQETEVRPGKVPGDRWRTEYFHLPGRPDAPLRLLAEDRSVTGWFAFQEPVEVGCWSYWAGFFLRRGGIIAVTAGVTLILLVIIAWIGSRLPRRGVAEASNSALA